MEKFEFKLISKLEATEENSVSTREKYIVGNYKVVRDLTVYEPGKNPFEDTYIEDFYIVPDQRKEYLPDIAYSLVDIGEDGKKTKDFKIQTTAYGSLSPTEIKKVIKGYQEAIEVVGALKSRFLFLKGGKLDV